MTKDTTPDSKTATFPFDIPVTKHTTQKLADQECVCPSCVAALLASVAKDISAKLKASGYAVSPQTTPIGLLMTAAALSWEHMKFTPDEFGGQPPDKLFTQHFERALRDAQERIAAQGVAAQSGQTVH